MDAETWKTIAIAAPWGVIIVVLRWIDTRYEMEKQKERDANSKEKSQADRESNQIVARAYADAINNLAKSITEQSIRIEGSIHDFKDTVLKQYEAMGITQDLRDELLELARGQRNK